MKTIAIANQKGGVGKTTTAVMLADGLMHCGYDVLFVDLDPQANSTSTYKAVVEGENTLYDLMNGACTTKEAIQHTEIGDIIAGEPGLTNDASKFLSTMGGFNIVKNALKSVQDDYDFCIIDTPPSLDIFMQNALVAANGVIIPIKAEKYAIDGLGLLIKTINRAIESEVNPGLKIYGVLMTAYDMRNALDKEIWKILPDVGKENGFETFKTHIRICQDIKNCQANGVSLFEHYASSNGAIDYANAIKELIKKVK